MSLEGLVQFRLFNFADLSSHIVMMNFIVFHQRTISFPCFRGHFATTTWHCQTCFFTTEQKAKNNIIPPTHLGRPSPFKNSDRVILPALTVCNDGRMYVLFRLFGSLWARTQPARNTF